jgi:hypothetical protein
MDKHRLKTASIHVVCPQATEPKRGSNFENHQKRVSFAKMSTSTDKSTTSEITDRLSLSHGTFQSISMGGFECVANLCQVCALDAHEQAQSEEIFAH